MENVLDLLVEIEQLRNKVSDYEKLLREIDGKMITGDFVGAHFHLRQKFRIKEKYHG